MTTKSEIENAVCHNTEQLCAVVEKLGYKGTQLTFPNGANLSSLAEFFNDNPGAIEGVMNFIVDNSDAYGLDDNDTCPSCGCKPGDGVTEDCDDEEGCGFHKNLEGAE